MPSKSPPTKPRSTKAIGRQTHKHGHNVVNLITKKRPPTAADPVAKAGTGAPAVKSHPGDARVQEAMRLAQAFLAIEDPTARSALIALAERLISYDWIRKVK